MPEPIHNQQCFNSHMGHWAIEPRWFQQAVSQVKAGTWKAMEDDYAGPPRAARPLYQLDRFGVAVIDMNGPMMKGQSKYGGVSTIQIRQALRQAVSDTNVASILLHIDSPGGHVAGTLELADEVRAADKIKPVVAHIDDMGASAAYWVASQARQITANATAEIGSIGVFAVLEDWSGAYEAAGVKVHVISTGPFKGAGAEGAPVTDEQMTHLREIVADLNQHFLAAVQKGRGMKADKLAGIADGRTFIAAKAMDLGLVDAVQSFDKTAAEMGKQFKLSRNRQATAETMIRLTGDE